MFDWTLSGPADFAQRVADQARDSGVAAVAAPTHLPEGFEGALRVALQSTHERLLVIEANGAKSPLVLLSEVLGAPIPSARPLRQDQNAVGVAILVRATAATEYALWDTTLRAYVSGCAARGQRWRFALLLLTPPSWDRALCAAGIVSFPWRNIISRMDSTRVALAAIGSGGNPLHDRLAVETAVALNGWDLELVFADARRRAAKLEALFETPRPASRSAASGMNASWEIGGCDLFDGRSFLHPALADAAELRRRVWEAQVSVLFGVLEQKRLDFVTAHRRVLQRFTADPRDYEWGQLAHFLRAEPRLHFIAEGCRLARNCLAHGEPIEATMFKSVFQKTTN